MRYTSTTYYTDTIWSITHRDDAQRKPLVYIGAKTTEDALRRAEAIRYCEPDLPPAEMLEATLLPEGPLGGAPYYAGTRFDWIEAAADAAAGEGACPLCGR